MYDATVDIQPSTLFRALFLGQVGPWWAFMNGLVLIFWQGFQTHRTHIPYMYTSFLATLATVYSHWDIHAQ